MRGSWSIVLGHIRHPSSYRVVAAVVLTVAIITALLFFLPPVKSINTTLQDLPATVYSTDGGSGFGYVDTLYISPREVAPGEKVTISLILLNTGDVEETYEVVLKINDIVEDTKEVTIGAGNSKTVTFRLSRDVPGTYVASVDGSFGSFIVKEGAPSAINWWLISGIVAAVVAVVVVIWMTLIGGRAR